MDLQPGLYILNYHGVGYESSPLLRGVGFHHSPDVFERHVEELSHWGTLASLDESIERLVAGSEFEQPTFCFWFDDGFADVRRFALPILRRRGIAAGMSICSRFVERQEMYWHCLLSALHHVDGLRLVRSRLRSLGYEPTESLKDWLTLNFSQAALDVITATYDECVPQLVRDDAFRIFDDEDGLSKLASEGWVLANHTAAHHPASSVQGAELVEAQFLECSGLVERLYDGARYMVVPFSCAVPVPTPPEFYYGLGVEGTLVDVGNRVNTAESFAAKRVIFRVNAQWRAGRGAPFDPATLLPVSVD